MTRHYDPKADLFLDTEGVEIYVNKFGLPETFKYVSPSLTIDSSVYFKPMVDFLVTKGYKEGEDLFGAPYDFRLGPV